MRGIQKGSVLDTIYGVGSALSPWAGIAGLGMQLAGSLMDEGPDYQQQQLDLEREKMKEQQRQFDLNLGFEKETTGKKFGLEGLDRLANVRTEAMQRGKAYRFNNALYSALSGGAR